MTIRLAEDLYERLRLVAFEKRVAMAELVREGIEMMLAAESARNSEVVHRDGDPRNNDPANLELRKSRAGQ